MAPRITISVDASSYDQDTQALFGKALPDEVRGGINRAASAVIDHLKAKAAEVFDNPTPFTLNAFGVLPADRGGANSASALIYVRPQQAEYLAAQIEGGIRRAGDYATTSLGPLVPGPGAKLDRHGNLPRGYVRRELASGNAWWGETGPG